MILQSSLFILFCVQTMTLYLIMVKISKNASFWWHCALHWWGEHRDLCRFWLWFYFLPKIPTKIRQINRERNYITRSCEKPNCILINNQHNYSINEHISINFLNPYNLWDMVPAALLSLNHTNDRYSISNQYTQPTTHQPRADPYPVFSSMQTMDSTKRGCASALHSFKELTYRTDEWTEQSLRLKS